MIVYDCRERERERESERAEGAINQTSSNVRHTMNESNTTRERERERERERQSMRLGDCDCQAETYRLIGSHGTVVGRDLVGQQISRRDGEGRVREQRAIAISRLSRSRPR